MERNWLFRTGAMVLLSLLAGCGGSTAVPDSGLILCHVDNDCPLGQYCNDGICSVLADAGCHRDEDCPTGKVCRVGSCVEVADGGDGLDGEQTELIARISVQPEQLNFGDGRIGMTATQKVTVYSAGTATLQIFSLVLETGTSDEFSLSPSGNLNRQLPPGESMDFSVSYTPRDGLADQGAVLISSNDPGKALFRLPLSSSYKGKSEITALENPVAGAEINTVDFGKVPVGQSEQREFFVVNTGSGSSVLYLEQIRTEPAASTNYALEVLPALPVWLSPFVDRCLADEDCPAGFGCAAGLCAAEDGRVWNAVRVRITFNPHGAGNIQEELLVLNDEGDGGGDGLERPFRIALRGEGTLPGLEVVPDPVDFGEVFTGQTVERQVVLKNYGNQRLDVQQVAIEGGLPFELDCAAPCSAALEPGGETALAVRYRPLQAASNRDFLVIESDAPGSPRRVSLLAVAVPPPVISLSHSAVDFSEVQIGRSAAFKLQVTNQGGSTLKVAPIELASGGSEAFSVLQNSLLPLAPGASAAVDLVFQPEDPPAVHRAMLRIFCNDPAQPLVEVPLYGAGIDPRLEVAPTAVDFGSIYINYRAGPVEVFLRNSGVGRLQLQSVALGAGTEPDFELVGVPQLPRQLAAGEMISVRLYFTPLFSGPRLGSLQIITDDIDGPLVEIPLRGDGSDCPQGWWDVNGDPQDGCEYRCDLSAGGVEDCDRQDNDCDGQTDEGLESRPCNVSNQYGTCSGLQTCATSGWSTCSAREPAAEVCDGDDNNCNGLVDAQDGLLVLAPCELQQGVCQGSLHRPGLCQNGLWQPCQAVDYGQLFGQEVCGNSLDEDCSGFQNDKDSDGDGFLDVACGGTDCDDLDPASQPGASEILDTRDNDCDGLVDEGLIPVGAVIVSEIMRNPDAVDDSLGEYFEITNVWNKAVNLNSFRVRDLGIDSFTVNVSGGMVLAPGQAAVLCRNAGQEQNGGVACDFDYENFALSNTEDEIILELAGQEIDRVAYSSSGWPSLAGRAMNLDPAAYSDGGNDLGSNWCNTPALSAYRLAQGDYGTPGAMNPTCSGELAVLSVYPTNGISAGGETITISGAGFSGATAVRLGGVDCAAFSVLNDAAISCLTPPHAAGDVDVTVEKGVNSRTLTAGYRYTAEATSGTIDWCVLQWPYSLSVAAGAPTPLIFGRIYQAGLTEPAGPPAGITAQVGYGPAGSDPRSTPGWLWFDTTWNPSCPDCGNDDEFMNTLTVTAAGQYSYAYRFSRDGGYTFVYADLPPGTSDGFSASSLGALQVQ